MSPRIPDDLSWLAMQYICDELSPADRDAFELQLADDQVAREAVAEAVESCAAVRLACGYEWPLGVQAMPGLPAENVPFAAGSQSWRRSFAAIGWMVSGAAACLLALMLLRDLPTPSGDSDLSAEETAERQALAQAYAASDYLDEQLHPWLQPGDSLDEVDLADRSYAIDVAYPSASADGIAASVASDPLSSPAPDQVAAGNSSGGQGGAAIEPLLASADDWMLALVAVDRESAGEPEQDN